MQSTTVLLFRHWRVIKPSSRIWNRRLSSSSSSPRSFPIGIFVDLDNVAPEPSDYTRPRLAQWIRPLKRFTTEVGRLGTFEGFANQNTKMYMGQENKENKKSSEIDQEYWDFLDDRHDEDDLFPGASVQTGYDEKGVLRCGICGQKMTLTKKNRKQGMTEEDKLEKHMRMLHDREQAKRKTRLKQIGGKKRKKFMAGKHGEKYRKYEAAQVGLNRPSVRPTTDKKKFGPKNNDLIQILKEEGMKCNVVHEVDPQLIKAARKWLTKTSKKPEMTDIETEPGVASAPEHPDARGALMVVSCDSDFVPLLQHAREQGFACISASLSDSQQTRSLVQASDVVLTRQSDEVDAKIVARPVTFLGTQLLWDLESQTFDAGMEDDIEQDEPEMNKSH